jgi:hypothetical protein
METITLASASPTEPIVAGQPEAVRAGDQVALSFHLLEDGLLRWVRIAVQFEGAVRLSAQLRRAIAREAAES